MDRFEYSPHRLSQPVTRASAVTPHATDEIEVTRAIYVGTGGDLVVTLADSASAITFSNVPDATVLPFRVKAVKATSTASDIVALY